MLKQLIFIILLGSSIGGLFYTYLILEKKTHLNTPVINCVPKDAALLLHIKKPLSLWASLAETNLIWDNLKEIEFVNNFDISLKKIDSTIQHLGIQEEKEITISFHHGTDKPSYLVAFGSNKKESKIISSQLHANKQITYRNIPIHKKEGSTPIYTCYLSPFTIISSNENTLQNSIDQLQKKDHLLLDSAFNKLYQKTNNSNNFQLYYNGANLKKVVIPYLKKNTIETWKTESKWSSLDVIISNNQLLLNGLTVLSINKHKIIPTKRIDINLLPTNLKTIHEYSFEKEDLPLKIVNNLNNECNCNLINLSKDWISDHFTKITFGNQQIEQAFYLEVNDNEHLLDQIKESIQLDSTVIKSHNIELYKLKNSSLNLLLNLNNNDIYFCIKNSHIVLSTLKGLQRLAFEWKKNKHTKPIFNYSIFSEEHLAQKANFSWFTTSDYLSQNITPSLKSEYQSIPERITKQLKHGFQIGYQTNTLASNLEHTALIIKTEASKNFNNNDLWELTLETPTSSSPQLLKNHKSKSLDIFLQDSTHNIHLINAAGRIKWSKKIQGEIIGKTQQVDIYGNNKYQILFNTSSHIHIIDINGNYVKGFPIKLDSEATSSVSIFDYENTHNYRFWISCNNLTTYNYDKEGKKVKGWNMPKSAAPIKKQFTRTVFNQKDYIYSIDIEGNVSFLNRRGESIYSLDQQLVAKDNNITLQRRASLATSSFIFQNDSNYQLMDYKLGNTSQVITLDENHPKLTYQIVDIDNNDFIDYLAVFQNKIELYGMDKTILRKDEFITNVENNYSLIESKNGKKFIIIKDENSDNLNILDAHLNQFNNSVITGDLNLAIGDINSDGKLNVVTIINNETIKVYSIN